jgi:hypothetical protein
LFLETIHLKFKHKTNRIDRKILKQNLEQLQIIWSKRLSECPYEVFKKISINGWDLFSFPSSHFAIPEGNSDLLNRAVKLVPPKHEYIIQEPNYDKLLEKVLQLESPDVSKLANFTGFDFFDHLARRVKSSGVWLPNWIKTFGKKFLS